MVVLVDKVTKKFMQISPSHFSKFTKIKKSEVKGQQFMFSSNHVTKISLNWVT